MKYNKGLRSAAAALALILTLATPAKACPEILAGEADREPLFPDLITGTADLQEDMFPGEEGEQESGIMMLGLSDEDSSIRTALNRAIGFLQAHSGNLVVGTEGGEWTLLALARNGGLSESARATYEQNLMTALRNVDGKLSSAKYTEYSRVSLALGAIGVNPRNVGGYDLIQPLSNFTRVCIQGINGPIWALIALDSRDYEVPRMKKDEKGTQTSREGILQFLHDTQLTEGGWALGGEVNPDMEPDDLCPMAIQALAPYYQDNPRVRADVDLALARWSKKQNSSGGFGDKGSSGAGGVEAIAQTIIALAALQTETGEPWLDSELFVKDGSTLMNALLSYQLPNGGFGHTKDQTDSNAIATDQATLAMTAWLRAAEGGRTRLYDLSDVEIQAQAQASPEEVQAFLEKMAAIPENRNLDHREAVAGLQLDLSKLGDFPEKEQLAQKIRQMQQDLDTQQQVLDQWDKEIWALKPAGLTLKDRDKVEDLRSRYNALPRQNRKYLKYPHFLIELEEKLLVLDNSDFPLIGEKKAEVQPTQPPKKPAGNSGSGQRLVVTTTTESNTETVRAENGIVKARAFESIQGKDRNLKLENKLDNGKKYVMTFHGSDIESAYDCHVQITLGSPYEKDIARLAENACVFHFENDQKFPGPAKVELPVSLEDGLYLLLRYDVQARKAQYVQKVHVDGGVGILVIGEGGHYFLAKKAISKSIDELDAMTRPTEAPTEAAGQAATEPLASEPAAEIPAGEKPSVNPWMIAGSAALTLAIAAVIAVIWMKNRKGEF